MDKNHVKLSAKDREYLEELIGKGKQKAKVFRRAMGLLELDRGKTIVEVAKICGVSRPTVMGLRDRYQELGLRCLEDAPRQDGPWRLMGSNGPRSRRWHAAKRQRGMRGGVYGCSRTKWLN